MDQNFTTVIDGKTIVVAPRAEESLTPNVRVWLVDDNDRVRNLVAEVLGREEGIECARHFSSRDALLSELASKPGPDVILLDVQMGDRNGLDAVRPIKSLARSTRVMMFTTCYNQEWRERALQEGASDYLLKKTPMEDVAARIRCPAEDPAPGYARRRSQRSKEQPKLEHRTGSKTEKSPNLLNRALKRFGLFSN